MTRDELKKRLIRVKGVPLKKIYSPKEVTRRGLNHVEITEDESAKYDDFFGFESDLAEVESARVQMENLEKRKMIEAKLNPVYEITEDVPEEKESSIILDGIDYNEEETATEEAEESFLMFDIPDELEEGPSGDDSSFLIFEEPNIDELIVTEKKNPKFKQCAFIKADEAPCKRQAPKSHDYCSSHRKMLEKRNK